MQIFPLHRSGAPAAILFIACVLAPPLAATGAEREPTYEERLTLGLQARRPSELEFVEAVVDTVNRGELPRKLVDRTFFWARERSPQRGGKKPHRPIIYFEPALKAQAEKLGVQIRRTT